MFRTKVESNLNEEVISEKEYKTAMKITSQVIKNEFKKGVKEDHAAMLVAFCINRMRTYKLDY